MSNTDWKSALGALLPDDYTPEADAPDPVKERKYPKLTVTVDRKRAGKVATIISGFDPDDDRAAKLAAEMKRHLATGGSSRGGEILIQGDRAEAVKQWLRNQGIKVS